MELMKHYSQFTENDIQAIGKLREKAEITKICRHCLQRLEERKILDTWEFKDFLFCIKSPKYGKVIEYRLVVKNGIKHNKLVIRSTYEKDGKNLIFSIDCEYGRLVTSYLNDSDYQHENLNLADYDSNLKIG